MMRTFLASLTLLALGPRGETFHAREEAAWSTFSLDEGCRRITYHLVVPEVAGAVAVDLHQARGAPAAATLLGPQEAVDEPRTLLAAGTLPADPAVVAALRAGRAYLDVHTREVPEGQMRLRLRPEGGSAARCE
jgi:hypothetical protein